MQETLDAELERIVTEYHATAVSAAVIKNGELYCSGGSGWAIEGVSCITADTKIRVASLSKLVLAMEAMALVEEGQLDLDAPLSTYWGSEVQNPYTTSQPTVESLMTHTSSLRELDGITDFDTLYQTLQSESSWRAIEPGSSDAWNYSNLGARVLGTTLELASGQVLENELQARFFQPLGIEASYTPSLLNPELLASAGIGMTISEQVSLEAPTAVGDSVGYLAGGLYISVNDLAKLVCVLGNDGCYDGKTFLQPASVQALETPLFSVAQENSSDFMQCRILRWQEDLLGCSQLFYHTGNAYGVLSLLSYDPETRNGVVVLTTGAPECKNSRGIYDLCADLSETLYAEIA